MVSRRPDINNQNFRIMRFTKFSFQKFPQTGLSSFRLVMDVFEAEKDPEHWVKALESLEKTEHMAPLFVPLREAKNSFYRLFVYSTMRITTLYVFRRAFHGMKLAALFGRSVSSMSLLQVFGFSVGNPLEVIKILQYFHIGSQPFGVLVRIIGTTISFMQYECVHALRVFLRKSMEKGKFELASYGSAASQVLLKPVLKIRL